MAPVPEAYFPSLDKCFSGDVQLLSWSRAFLYTCHPDDDVDDTGSLHTFLSHPESVQLLSNCLNSFPSPSAKSKSDFESKTAAIHAETTAQASYDLKEIKADALWLSQKAGIDETSALRITVLEWQNRPATRLVTRIAEGETASLQAATGVENFRRTVSGPSFPEVLGQYPRSENDASFASEVARRLRLRNLYLLERSHIIKTARKLLALFLTSKSNGNFPQQNDIGRFHMLCELGAAIFKNKLSGEGRRSFIQECIKNIQSRLSALKGDGGWLGAAESDESMEDMWRTTLVEEILHILQMLFLQLQASTEILAADLQLSWLRLMVDYSFLEPLQVSFVCLITVAFLKLHLTVPFIIDKASVHDSSKLPYFLSKEEIGQINEIFVTQGIDSKVANPAAFSWGLILHTMRELAIVEKEARELQQFHSAVDSFQSNTPHSNTEASEVSLYEELLECAQTPKFTADESIAVLTSDAIKYSAFDAIISLATNVGSTSAIDDPLTDHWTRTALLDLIRVAMIYLEYSPEVVESVLAILSGSATQCAGPSSTPSAYPSDPRYNFTKDDLLMNNIFRIARSRFPYETIPFLRFCRALVNKDMINEEGLPEIVSELENMETFTQMVPGDFQGYETIREDENANLVTLAQSLPMIGSASPQIPDSQPRNALVVTGSSQVPSATIGQVVSESKPAVVMWHHRYSCLSYLGSWLEEWNESGGYSAGWGQDSNAEIIGLLADLLTATKDVQIQKDDGSSAKRILEMASDGLARQSDIISVIFEIFERNISSLGPKTGSDSMEVTSGEYPFLLACVRLFEAVVDDAASRAVLRKSPNPPAGKIISVSGWTAGVPSHMMRGTLLSFVRAMIEVYNSSINWRFNTPEQRIELNTGLAKTFERILYYTYGANDTVKLDGKVTGVFSSSATYLLDVLRPQSAADLPFNPILRLIADGLQTPPTLYLRHLTLVENQVKSTLEFSTRLLQAAQLLDSSPSLLEEQLFKAAPVLVKLYALHHAYRLPVISLLDTLVCGAALDPANEPPSLVGHLGAESSCLFLDVLSQFDKPLSDRRLHLAVWHMLSTLVSKRQQWLAVYILTGSSPRQTLKTGDQKAPAMRGAPFLKIALDVLSNIGQIEPQASLPLLEFISHAQENWPWATPELKKHPQFFTSIVNYVSKLKISSMSVVDQIYGTRIASVVADICTVYLHSAKEMHDQTFYKMLIPLVSWYAKDAVDVSGYNASLHANLRRNFEMRYPGCKLVDFKRTVLQPRSLGRDYCYDLYLGEKLLAYDFAWAGTRNQGFAQEFERANLNLSLVEAQVGLLHSWKFFAIEHCSDFMTDREVQKSMALVVRRCLEANTNGVPQEAIFDRVQQTRVEFSQALLQRLVEIRSKGAEVFSLLGVVWDTLRTRRATYEDALINDDTDYYRSLLNVLFLALQFHLDSPSRTVPETISKKAEISSDLTFVVEIVKTVVAQGFKSLTTYLHEQPEKCTPKDFAILTAILQSCLQVKNVDRLYEHMVYHIADNDTARHAASLFSWADQLAIAGDPVYGDLSISFLVKLSTIPMLAEHLAVEAVLARLATCRLTDALRQPKGFGPFDPVPRMYAIWTNGILPLCLNLLYHVIRTAPEVAAFLNQFEGQLTRAAECFATGRTSIPTGTTGQKICLSMASEAYSLALISFIINQFRKAGASMGVDGEAIQELKWDKGQVKEDIEELLERRSNLRARIVAIGDKEVELVRQKPVHATSGAENRLEEKIVGELQAVLVCLGGEEAE
ncbi:hypothetical protein EYZ11_006712 [Aspergillus tanneri]|uniref:Uncharacterized protein n=1 Tax=Aspergillus tanneri TaxID=1220188 RepID=A0A4S3JET4_9EURO|nr:hypothetical protein EYZ11_006712 [Aspergillus tanneri]